MGKQVLTAVWIIGFLIIPCFVHAEVYQWIDNKGTIHFTDNESNIPSSDRERFKVEIRKEIREEGTAPGSQEIVPRAEEEQTKPVVYGEEEVERSERTRSWMEKLEEAIAN